MERKDEGVASIFIENGFVEDIGFEPKMDTFYADERRPYYNPTLNRYTLSFTTPDKILCDNPITMHKGDAYEILIMIRRKQ